MHDKVSASIVLYKSDPGVVRGAIESFLSGADGKLYLIDNSPDDRLRMLHTHPRIEYIFNNQNLGFGAGHNVAIRETMQKSMYHIVLNPDVYFDNHVIASLTEMMDKHPDIGLATPKVLYPNGNLQRTCRLLPSPGTLLLRRFATSWMALSHRMNRYELDFSGYNRIMDVPFLSGCFMFLRTEALQKSGLFDERIFLYTEDIDLTRRMHKYFRTVFFPNVSIFHIHARGSYKALVPFLLHVRSAITYFNKWGWFRDDERDIINEATILKLAAEP